MQKKQPPVNLTKLRLLSSSIIYRLDIISWYNSATTQLQFLEQQQPQSKKIMRLKDTFLKNEKND